MSSLYAAFSRLLKRRARWIVTVFALLLPLVGLGALRAIQSNSNDVKRWLPDQYPETRSLNDYQRQFGMGSDAEIVLVWPHARLDYVDPATLDPDQSPAVEADESVARFAELLRAARLDPHDAASPKLLDNVRTGPEMLREMTRLADDLDQNVLGLPLDQALERLDGALIGPDYLHGLLFDEDAPQAATIALVEVDTAAHDNGLRPGDVVASVNGQPTPDAAAARQALAASYAAGEAGTLRIGLADGRTASWTWRGPRPGRQTAILAALSEQASAQKRLEVSVNRIRALAEQAGIAAADLRMGGPPVDNVSIDVEGRRTLERLAWLSFVVGFVMCWACLGRLKLTVLVFFTSLFSEGTSLALVYWTGGTVDAILMTMPSLIYVLTISGAIHIVNYYRDSLLEVDAAEAPALSVKKGFLPCSLAAGTTAVGLASLYISDLVPIRNFGVYSALAVMTSLLWTFFFIPAVLQLSPLREKARARSAAKNTAAKQAAETNPHQALEAALTPLYAEAVDRPKHGVLKPIVGLMRRVGEGILRRKGLVTAAGVAVTAFFTVGIIGFQVRVGQRQFEMPGLRTSVTLMKLFSDEAQIVHDYRWIESKLTALVPMEVVVSTDNAERIILSGDPAGGSYVVSWAAYDGTAGETVSLPFDAGGEQVRQALLDSGLTKIVVETSGSPPNLTHLVRRQKGGEMPPLQVVSEGELTDNHLRVVNAVMLLRRLQMLDEARRGIEALPEVDTTLSAVTFAPQLPQRGRGWDTASSQIDKGLNQARPKLIESGFLANEQGRDLLRISLRIGAFADVDYSDFVRHIRNAVDPVVYAAVLESHAEDAHQARWRLTKQIVDEAGGPSEFHFVLSDEAGDAAAADETFGVVRVDGDGRVTATIDGRLVFDGRREDLPASATYTGIVPLVYKAQNELLKGLFKSYALAFVLIAAVMILLLWPMAGALKSLPAAVLVMLPNFFPTAIVFGGMAWMGVLVDIGTMMTASVALGVAVDDTLHYLTWYRRGVENGLSRRQAARYAYGHCATAMTQTTIVCAVGMATFALSTFQPTMRFGVLMVPLMAAALIGDLVLLPALLVSRLGWFFDRRPAKLQTTDAVDLPPALNGATSGERPLAPSSAPSRGGARQRSPT